MSHTRNSSPINFTDDCHYFRMAENSRMSKLSSKDDEYIFSWKLFTGWDFMIGKNLATIIGWQITEIFFDSSGHAETAHNRIASVVLGFKEALLEEAEKKKDKQKFVRNSEFERFIHSKYFFSFAVGKSLCSE